MFGAGIGIGMLTYATAEPIYHFSNNPDVIRGTVTAVTAENVRPTFQWSFLHWGLSALACYALVGLALPFSFVMAFMGVSPLKALIRDSMRENAKTKK